MDAALGPPDKMVERQEELTPMLAQYFELCEEYDDALVLFQVGDFYEAFCEAAETVARTCEITLTKREDSTGQYAMAGVPIDNAESYIERLLDAGYRIAVADQVQEPAEATGVVDRAVTRVITPGTLTEVELLDGDDNNYVAALAASGGGDGGVDEDAAGLGVTGETYAVAVLDVSTGDFYATSGDRAVIADELGRFAPAEAVVGPDASADVLAEDCVVSPCDPAAFERDRAHERVGTYFGAPERLLAGGAEIRACGALLAYAEYARGGEERLGYLNHLTRYDPRDYMLLDAVALDSLELFERRAVRGREGATLVEIVDETASALGRRKLDDWLRRPLLDADRIAARHDAVAELVERVRLRERVHDRLRDVYDIERLVSRVARRRADARDLRSLAETLAVVPDLREALAGVDCERLASLRSSLDELEDVRRLIEDSIQEDPDRELTDGGIIRLSYDDELATLRETEREGKAWIDDLEQRERERTGIDSLKVGHNAVHGYYIEVTEANLDRVPDDYERRQTLKNAERYYTPELKQREDEILGAESRADDLEYELFSEIRGDVAAESARLQALAEALATLDVLVSFGTVAAEYGYTRPTVVPPDGDVEGVHVEGGRHPVVERTQESFVPNDAFLDVDRRLAVITGPNMSGKSTYMRQVALIVVLAQAGSFVPASSARLAVIDRVFTRVGASDDIAGGRSTFMIEMTELAEILERADDRSLVILDEVGRGTSTADGLAIARAVTEYLHDEVGALTLFATHHHDLTAAAARLDSAVNLHFRTGHEGGDVAFEHAVETGVAAASYGVEVAATAGLPGAVVERARECLGSGAADGGDATHESGDTESEVDGRTGGGGRIDAATNGHPSGEAASGGPVPDRNGGEALPVDVRATLDEVDIANTTPLEAMNVLAALKRRVNR